MTGSELDRPPTSNHAEVTRGRPFQNGNTAGRGRPEGSRNKATLLLDRLADDEAEAIQRQVIEAAKGGDLKAAELILARIWPPRRGRARPARAGTGPDSSGGLGCHGRGRGCDGLRRGHARGGSDHLRRAGGAAQGA
jgi:hypothetical protein